MEKTPALQVVDEVPAPVALTVAPDSQVPESTKVDELSVYGDE